jgi:hypothetical protein
MKFSSPREDFVVNTLAAIPSCIEKLNFMLNIREENGEFVHWGLERMHGSQSTRAALREAYRSVVRDVLSTPVQDLWNEVDVLRGDVDGQSNYEYFRKAREAVLVPVPNGQADELHLRFILDGLLLAAKGRRASRNA